MTDISIKDIGKNIITGNTTQARSVTNEPGTSFQNVIDEALNKVSQVQKDVDTAVNELATGGDITTAVLAIEKADMTFQLMTEVRNKLLSTYQEIMRMQV